MKVMVVVKIRFCTILQRRKRTDTCHAVR